MSTDFGSKIVAEDTQLKEKFNFGFKLIKKGQKLEKDVMADESLDGETKVWWLSRIAESLNEYVEKELRKLCVNPDGEYKTPAHKSLFNDARVPITNMMNAIAA